MNAVLPERMQHFETQTELIDPRKESLPIPPPPHPSFANRLDGVIVLVSENDVYLAKACCASIRQSMGNIPITLLVDGLHTDTSEIERLPNVNRLSAPDLAGEEYSSFWSGFWVKMLVFNHSPYERFLYLDADTLVWGDVRVYADLEQYDFIAGLHFDMQQTFQSEEEIRNFVFDVDAVRKIYPNLNWPGMALANNGAFFARRHVFGEKQLKQLKQMPCWVCYEQGMINFLRWRAIREGQPRVSGCRVQLYPAQEGFQSIYTSRNRFFPRNNPRPAIIHWICKKPKFGRRYKAADDYRKLFLKMTGRKRWLRVRLRLEEFAVWLGKHKRSLLRQKNRS